MGLLRWRPDQRPQQSLVHREKDHYRHVYVQSRRVSSYLAADEIALIDKGKSIPNVPILDKCMGCSGDDLDMSRQLFIDLFQGLGGDITGYGRIPGDHPDFGHVTWKFDP